MTLQILLECGRSDPHKTVAGLIKKELLASVFRSPKANDPDDIWQLQLKCLAVLTPSMKGLVNSWEVETLVNRLLIFGKAVLAKARAIDALEKKPAKPKRSFEMKEEDIPDDNENSV